MAAELGPFGLWSQSAWWTEGQEAAAELEELGYSALWLGGSPRGDLLIPESVLDATKNLVVGTSIVNVWSEPADVVSASYQRIAAKHPDRFLLGIGAGHRELVGEAYQRPYEKLVEYLDELDVPADRTVLAALGPRVLRLAAERTAGAIPYLVTPEHTARAREILGPDRLLAPEQKVVLETDPDAARTLGRRVLKLYLSLPNYTNNLLRLGFTEEDFAAGGSDRLVDALICWGEPERIAARLREHHTAGADHVAIQVVSPEGKHSQEAFRRLAPALFG
jgi:probable F420-dependent oxidoreductase